MAIRNKVWWCKVGLPAMVGVVQIPPLHPAQEPGHLGLIQIEAGNQTASLDVVKCQDRQVVAICLLSKGKHVKLPALLCILPSKNTSNVSNTHCYRQLLTATSSGQLIAMQLSCRPLQCVPAKAKGVTCSHDTSSMPSPPSSCCLT